MTAIVEVAPGLASWSYGDTTLEGGSRHDVGDADAELAGAVAAAVHAGALVLIDGDLDAGAVESDKESLRKLKVADAARGELYAERDEELRAADAESAADKLAEWETRMAEAAQAAVEKVS